MFSLGHETDRRLSVHLQFAFMLLLLLAQHQGGFSSLQADVFKKNPESDETHVKN